MSSGVLASFLGAVQAALSVLLTICFGVAASQFGLVSAAAAEQISHLCVSLLLPCLLVVNLGEELQLDNAIRYVPIVIWATIFTVSSIFIGRLATAVFRLPAWATPAIAFNNTQSLPLLLLQSLETTGVLSSLVGAGDEAAGVRRARTYFLACSVVSTTLTFATGPEILHESPADQFSSLVRAWRWVTGSSSTDSSSKQQQPENGRDGTDPESQRLTTTPQHDGPEEDDRSQRADDRGDATPSSSSETVANEDGPGEEEEGPNERTSLLPSSVTRLEHRAEHAASARLGRLYAASPRPLRAVFDAVRPFLNPPFIGAVAGLIIGLAPPLHRLFFADMAHGGYLSAWLTASLRNVGELFVALQVVVVGVKLSLTLRLWRRGEESGSLPLGTVLCVVLVRFVLWPAISIPLIWALAAKTNVLPDDPILWWAMMMMPIGPTAMKVLALADVSDISQKVRMSIALFLALSYLITPLISFAVVGALEAAKAAR
ncbi:auxin efflux carrier [Xylariaceae sp. FL0804]|nr:auxin efflux carrier [Xylariaceae sp. FL0804]